MKKNFKRWLAILAVFALMSVSVFSNASVSAKAVEGDAEQQEEISNQEEEITNQDNNSGNPDGEGTNLENGDEESDGENSNQKEGSLEEPAPRPRMMLLGASPDPSIVVSFEVGEGGILKYKIDEGSWTTVPRDGLSSVIDGATIYLKATPDSGKKIDEWSSGEETQNWVECNSVRTNLDIEQLASGAASFTYTSGNTYKVQVRFQNDQGGPAPSGNPVSFNLREGGTLKYKINDGSWATAPSEGLSSVSDGATIYLKATPNSGKKIDDWSSGEETQNWVEFDGNHTYFSINQLVDGTASFTYAEGKNYRVQVSFVNSGDPGPGPGPSVENGKYIVSISQEVSEKTGSISVQFYNGDAPIGGSENYSYSVSEGISIPEDANSVKISVTEGSDILNNARLENRTDGDEADLIDDMRGDEATHSSIQPIDSSKAYEIKIAFSNTMSVSWTYNTSDSRRDMIVEHARIELLNSDNATDYTNEGKTDWQLTAGETYYFVLIPDYGYQVSGLNINGQAIEPMNSVGVFKFIMSHSNFHLQGIVSPSDDIAENNAEVIGDIGIDGDGAVDSGNVMVSATDATTDNAALNAVSDSQATAFGTIDLSLSQAISKGNGQYWKTSMSETNNPVNISVVVPAGELSEGETYSIVRNHNGVYEELNADYDSTLEELSFASDKFSEYTIIKKENASPSPSPSPTKPSETKSSEQATNTPSSGSSDSSSVVPAAVPDTTVVASIGGTTVTEKDTKDNVAVMVGGTKNGAKISEWNELAAYLATPQTATPMGTTSQTASLLAKPIELVLCKKNTVVPETVFDSLAVNPAPSMHIHIRDGVAINFINDANLTNQQAVDLKCVITSQNGYANRISFNSNAMLNAITTIHATVPKTVKSVNVYTIDKQGKKTLLWANIPVIDGRYCFLINQLGTFEIEVTPQS